MNYKFIIATAILGIGMASCSNEELDSLTTSSQNAVGFNVVTNAASRATIIDQSNIKEFDFNVVAYTHNDDPNNRADFMGNGDTNGGVTIKHNGTTWTYNNPSDVHYWPATNDKFDFYAVSPATAPANSNTYYWNIGKETQTIYYLAGDEYGGSSTSTQNIDVMYAIAKEQTKDTNSGKVKFTFKHILSQVAFQAKVENTDMTVDINQIQLANAKFSGTFTFPTDDNSDGLWTLYSNSEHNLGYINAYKGDNVTVNTTNTATEISNNKHMLVIPQKLEPWTVNGDDKTIANANSNKRSFLCIMCKIRQGDVYIHGTASDYAALYIPFSADWKPGKRYIYTIIFGGGYNDNGESILNPINFEASVSDWATETEGSFDIKY